MLKLLLLALTIGVISAQLSPKFLASLNYYKNPELVKTVRSHSDRDDSGNFNYGFETTHGIRTDAKGIIKNPYARLEDRIQQIGGSYAYYTPDGNLHEVSYIADENGYKPKVTFKRG